MKADKPGRHDQPLGVDHVLGLVCVVAADAGDLAVLDRDVAAESGRPQAVDDRAAGDEGVELHEGVTSVGTRPVAKAKV